MFPTTAEQNTHSELRCCKPMTLFKSSRANYGSEAIGNRTIRTRQCAGLGPSADAKTRLRRWILAQAMSLDMDAKRMLRIARTTRPVATVALP